MIAKLLPVILLLVGAGAGVGAGMFLRPAPEPAEQSEEGGEEAEKKTAKTDKEKGEEAEKEEDGLYEYLKMTNQFVVPVVDDNAVSSMVVLSLSLEVAAGTKGEVYAREPKLRDSFLQVLFDHANIGGFSGAFTETQNMRVLRAALREVAERDMGDAISDVLILEIARQDF